MKNFLKLIWQNKWKSIFLLSILIISIITLLFYNQALKGILILVYYHKGKVFLISIITLILALVLPKKIRRFVWKHKWKFGISVFSLFFFIALLPVFIISYHAKNKIYTMENISNIPKRRVAIVLGAAITKDQKPSLVLDDRIKTATDLYHAGKVEKILMSGGNPTEKHNESMVMTNWAIKKYNIPAEDVVTDYAGFRTFDTCARAKKVFMLDEAIVISQESHLPRTIYLCDHMGIEVFGVSGDQREYRAWYMQHAREFVAKIFAFWETHLFKHEATVLGDTIEI